MPAIPLLPLPIIVTNTATKPYLGWCECIIPADAIVAPIVAVFTATTGRKTDAWIGEQIGVRGKRAYFFAAIEPVRQLFGAIDANGSKSLTPLSPDIPLVGIIGKDFVSWSVDTTTNDGPCAVRRLRARLGPFVFSLICWRFTDEPWTRFELSMVHSDPSNADMNAAHSGVTIGHSKAYVHVTPPTLEPRATALESGGWARNIYPPSTLGNGQGHAAIRGVLCNYLGEKNQNDIMTMNALLEEDVTAQPIGAWKGKYGPYGVLPALNPSLGNGNKAAVARYMDWLALRHSRSPWATSTMGLLPYPGSGGTQDDFGLAKNAEVLSSDPPSPFNIHEMRQSGYEEWRRPIHYRETDASPLQAVKHPDWHSWGETTHWSPSQSPDRLGKPSFFPPVENHEFAGRDNQHNSALRLCGTAQIDGSRILLEEINDHVEHWLAHVFDSAGRARGRMLQSGCWYYLLSARTDLLDAIIKNLQLNFDSWPSKGHDDWQVRVSHYDYPDPRQISGKAHWWNGFNEGLAYPGLWAAWNLTKHPLARQLCKIGAYSFVRWAWFRRGDAHWRLCYGIKYNGFSQDPSGVWKPNGTEGTPLSAAEYADPQLVEDGGVDFEKWAYAAIWVANRIATEDGDAADVLDKSAEIISQIRGSQVPTATFDQLDEWLAIS